jgi:hypothetical protein
MGVKGFSGILHGGITGPESGLNAGRDHGFTVESRATGHSDQLDGGAQYQYFVQYSIHIQWFVSQHSPSTRFIQAVLAFPI